MNATASPSSTTSLAPWLLAAALQLGWPAAALGEARPAAPAPRCATEYADDFGALLPRARALEEAQASYTFCIRSAATYECPYYGPGGVLQRSRRRVVAHGTGFGLRQQDGGTLLVTNEHVAEWPATTDAAHPVDGVPPGCRRLSDDLRVVDGESDDDDRDDLALARVAVDPQLDVAVVRAPALLPVLPWRIGHSAGLRERNVVNVRGFPLGRLKAENVGKVVSLHDRDEYKDWVHDDFVIDALLSPGNSGSPVLAVSCKTGELELVGIHHATYTGGTGLNIVVSIDQVRDLLATLTPSPRVSPGASSLDAAARAELHGLAAASPNPFFPLGGLAAEVRPSEDGRLVFELFSAQFPARVTPLLVLEDQAPPAPSAFGSLGRIWAGNARGLKEVDRAALDAETAGTVGELLEALRADGLAAFRVRAAEEAAGHSKERHQEAARLRKALDRSAAARQGLADLAVELAERLGPKASDAPAPVAVLAPEPRPWPIDPIPVPGQAPAAAAEGPRRPATW